MDQSGKVIWGDHSHPIIFFWLCFQMRISTVSTCRDCSDRTNSDGILLLSLSKHCCPARHSLCVSARHNSIQTVNVKKPGLEITDGERLPLAIKELGSCEVTRPFQKIFMSLSCSTWSRKTAAPSIQTSSKFCVSPFALSPSPLATPLTLPVFQVYPQSLVHSPNGRMVSVCGDGEHIIFTALAWRNKSFGSALEFCWSQDSSRHVEEHSIP